MKTQYCPTCKGTLTSITHQCPKGTPKQKDQNHYNQQGLPVVYVENLASDDTMMFVGLSASEAVMSADMHAKHIEPTSFPQYYTQNYRRLVWGKLTVAMGDYCTTTKINR